MVESLINLPNWRNKDEYKYALKFKNNGLAWEYLRRNPKYISDYDKYIKLAQKYEERFQEGWQENTETFVYSPRRKKGETYKDWVRRVRSKNPKFKAIPLVRAYASKWYLADMYDYRLMYSKQIQFLPVPKSPIRIDDASDLDKYMKKERVYSRKIGRSSVDEKMVISKEYAVLVFRLQESVPAQIGQPPFQSPPFKLQFCGIGGIKEGAGA